MNKLEKFIIKLKKVHGDNIDTSKVEYVRKILIKQLKEIN